MMFDREARYLKTHEWAKKDGALVAVGLTGYARMDLAESWPEFYKKWVRTWDAPSPDRLVITDEYELAKGDGVEFLWQTVLPVEIDQGKAVITGKNATVLITPDPDCSLRMDQLDTIDDGKQNRIIIRRDGKKGQLNVRIRFIVNPKGPFF